MGLREKLRNMLTNTRKKCREENIQRKCHVADEFRIEFTPDTLRRNLRLHPVCPARLTQDFFATTTHKPNIYYPFEYDRNTAMLIWEACA